MEKLDASHSYRSRHKFIKVYRFQSLTKPLPCGSAVMFRIKYLGVESRPKKAPKFQNLARVTDYDYQFYLDYNETSFIGSQAYLHCIHQHPAHSGPQSIPVYINSHTEGLVWSRRRHFYTGWNYMDVLHTGWALKSRLLPHWPSKPC